jgi:hypothetical protein
LFSQGGGKTSENLVEPFAYSQADHNVATLTINLEAVAPFTLAATTAVAIGTLNTVGGSLKFKPDGSTQPTISKPTPILAVAHGHTVVAHRTKQHRLAR